MPKIIEMAHMVLSKGFNFTAKCKQGQCNHYAADIYQLPLSHLSADMENIPHEH